LIAVAADRRRPAHASACHDRIVATRSVATAGQIELRGRGILTFPHEQGGVIRLVVDIVGDEGLERCPSRNQLSTTLPWNRASPPAGSRNSDGRAPGRSGACGTCLASEWGLANTQV